MISNELVSIHWTCHTILLGFIAPHTYTHMNYYHYQHLIGSNNEKCPHARSSISPIAIHFSFLKTSYKLIAMNTQWQWELSILCVYRFSLKYIFLTNRRIIQCVFVMHRVYFVKMFIEFGLVWLSSDNAECTELTANEWTI